jgi:hypothetical protein
VRVHRLWARYRWEFVNYAAMTAFGLLELSSAMRFHREARNGWLAASGVLLLVVGSANLFLLWRKLPTTDEG